VTVAHIREALSKQRGVTYVGPEGKRGTLELVGRPEDKKVWVHDHITGRYIRTTWVSGERVRSRREQWGARKA
jgi:hypothetical protein